MRDASRLSLLLTTLACLCCNAGAPSGPQTGGTRHDPTVVKMPSPSRSLTIADNWVPPAPVRSAPATRNARVKPKHEYGAADVEARAFSDRQLGELPLFAEPLVPVPGASSSYETIALGAALAAFQANGGRDIGPLEDFVKSHSGSRWSPVLHLNLGIISYDTGYFSRALQHWQQAWELAKGGTDSASQNIANRAVAEYAKMNARVGRKDELDRIFAETADRQFMGDARVKMESAAEGRWTMEHRPGVAFRCGPYALTTIAPLLDPEAAARSAVRSWTRCSRRPPDSRSPRSPRCRASSGSSCAWPGVSREPSWSSRRWFTGRSVTSVL
jgi:hypothetical protein